MKRVFSIILCILILFAFNACSSNNSDNESTVQEMTSLNSDTNKSENLDEDYLSMFRSNQLIFCGDSSGDSYLLKYTPYKDSDDNYYFFDVYTNSIYTLSAAEFAKSCSEEKLWQMGDNLENGILWSHGETFFKFNAEMQNVFVQIYKDNLYVSGDGQNLFKISCSDSSDYEQINLGRDFSTYFFYNDEIYFIDMYGGESGVFSLYKTDLQGNNLSVVLNGGEGFANASNDEIYNVYISNDYLYFVLREDGFESNIFLYCRCKLDGSEKEIWKINDGNLGLTANDNNVAVVVTNQNTENNNGYVINVNTFNSDSLEEADSFSVSTDDEVCLNMSCNAMLYSNGSIDAYITGQSYDGSLISNNIKINFENQTINVQSYDGILTNSRYNETYLLEYNELDNGNIVGFYDKL